MPRSWRLRASASGISLLTFSGPAVRAARRRPNRWRSAPTHRRREGWVALAFVAPFLIIFLAYTLLPAVYSLFFSFTDITARDMRNPLNVDVVGLENFANVMTRRDFGQAALNTLIFVILGAGGTITAGLGLALALDALLGRLKTMLRAAFYLPVITNVVAAAMIWQYALAPRGTLDRMLRNLGLESVSWLDSQPWATLAVTALGIWRNMGTAMVIFLAGLQSVPEDVQEAAALDGAGPARRFVSVTLPLLIPTILLVSVLMSTSFMQIFEEVYLLTGGAPVGTTTSLSVWIFQQFGFGNTAVAFTGSFILLALATVINLVQFRLLRSRT